MLNRLKKLATGNSQITRFRRICAANNLTLDYATNRDELPILADIFEKREYADYFPFYSNAVVVDIGAHCGYFSLFAEKNLQPNSRIFSIEPSKSNFQVLVKNLQDNDAQSVVPLNTAIGAVNTTQTLHTGRSANHTLLSDYALMDNTEGEEQVTVQTLGAMMEQFSIGKIDFLKMDCEGSEYAILENLEPDVFEKTSVISMEFHDLRSEKYNARFLTDILEKNNFHIVKFQYESTTMGLNYGKIIGKK